MQLEYAEKEAVSRRALKVKFNIPAVQSSAVHRDEVTRISSLGDKGLMSVSQDGQLCFWKVNRMTPFLGGSKFSNFKLRFRFRVSISSFDFEFRFRV